MDLLIIPIVTALGMIAGQSLKWLRRIALPIASLGFGIKNKKKRTYFLILLGLVLSMGYGEGSKIRKLLGGSDVLTRIVYGLFVGGVVAIAGFLWSLLIMPLAFLFNSGRGFKVGRYDWLWDDFVRYSALGTCIYFAIH